MEHRVRPPELPPIPPPAPLTQYDPAIVRVGLERDALTQLWQEPGFCMLASSVAGEVDPAGVRRQLLAHALRLSPSMAPDLYRVASQTAEVLSVTASLELYQAAGDENARMHLVREPALLEVQGRLLALLDDDTLRMLLGHELGHYLAHGDADGLGAKRIAARIALAAPDTPDAVRNAARVHSLACEFTADRFGLLACQDLNTALRLSMICTTGLSGDTLAWDTEAYRVQCVELCEQLLEAGDRTQGLTHPEHSVRGYALWLFSESDAYRNWTGKGPGRLTLAQVDAELARLVGANPPQGDATSSLFEVPLIEVHEFALASAVLVAWADGTFDEAEADALEEAFAPLVPDWRGLFDQQAANLRFTETLPVMRAADAQQHLTLFHLLAHVMAVDGVVTTAELETILGIGQALGQLPLFQRLLKATLETLGVTLEVDAVPPAPLRVSAAEASDALACFIQNIQRRGQGSATVRRLLRLVGERVDRPEVRGRIADALRAAEIVSAPDLIEAPLNRTVRLTAPESSQAVPDSPALMGVRAELQKALVRLREKLVSGDGRSPSVRLRKTRSGRAFDLFALEAVKTGQAERVVEAIRGRQPAPLVRAAEAGIHDPAQRCVDQLTELDRAARDQQDETGAHDLFLGYPMLRGCLKGAYLVRGPLLLYPVDLIRDARGARGFQLAVRPDEEPVINLALLRTVFNKLNYALTDNLIDDLNECAADPAAGVDAVLARLTEVGVDIVHTHAELARLAPIATTDDADEGPVRIEECALLGLFPQSSSDLLQDYDALLKAIEAGEPLAELLSAAQAVLPASLQAEVTRQIAHEHPLTQQPLPRPPVVKADPSQRAAVALARQQRALVVDGPPGTGKSQVIVNLVADALARGERVAVVCEKRAALDVVSQRLEALGLRNSLAVVHDLNDDRKPLFAQLVERFTAKPPSAYDAEEEAAFAANAQRYAEALAERDADLARCADPGGLTYGQLLLLAHGTDAPDLCDDVQASLAAVSFAGKADLERRALRLQTFEPIWHPNGRWRGPAAERWRPIHDEAALQQARSAIDAAIAAADALEACTAEVALAVDPVRDAGQTLADAQMALQRASTLDRACVLRCLERIEAAGGPDGLAVFTAARAAFKAAQPAMMDAAQAVERPAHLAETAVTVRRWNGRFWRWFVPGWWRARSTLADIASKLWPTLASEAPGLPLLEEVESRFSTVDAWNVARAELGASGLGAVPDTVKQASEYLARTARCADAALDLWRHKTTLTDCGVWCPPMSSAAEARWDVWTRQVDAAMTLQAHIQTYDAALEPVTDRFSWTAPDSTAAALTGLSTALATDGPRLLEIDELLVDRSDEPPMLPLVDALAAIAPSAHPTRWQAALTRAWARARIARLEAAAPHLTKRGQTADDRRAQTARAALDDLQDTLAEIEVERIRHRLAQAPVLLEPAREKFARKTETQAVREALLKEASKKRRLMTLRAFVRRFSHEGLLDVLPVWLLSPETMAVLFERTPLFDLVVLDEASQCTVQAGFPVLLRARRVVVAGDEHQMPPTAFFQMSDDAPDDLDADEQAVRDVFASESLLTLARGRCAHTRLNWHYRCLHESLIAFSNHAIYEGDLQTIPATATPHAARALRWVAVPEGEYDAGANPPEAERVVALLHELLAERPERTLGVVTFNLKQRRTVLDAIDARRRTDDAFEALWAVAEAQSPDQRPFVKNLEAVQGDERDVIIFSLAHAPRPRIRGGQPTGDYYVPARFGPLGQRGGERRLNVAISRAREACYVVASFAPEQLSVSSSTHRGPMLFKQFLDFAYCMDQGRLAEADRVLDRVRQGPRAKTARTIDERLPAQCSLAAQLALALEAEGVPVARSVGRSEFTIPVAVHDPSDPARFKLAILLHDGTEVLDPFEAHVHRPAVLRLRGWAVMNVTAADWVRRPAEVVQAIIDAVPNAQGALDRPIWAQRAGARAEVLASVPPPGHESATAAWHLEVAAKLRPLLAVLEREGSLTRDQATRLLNRRAFDRLRFQLDALRTENRLPWDFAIEGESIVCQRA